MQTALAISTQQKQAIVERVSLLEQELRTCKERREEERRALVEENQTLRSEVRMLSPLEYETIAVFTQGYSLQQAIEELRSSQLRGPENHSLAELETKVSSLTEQLLKKQSQVHSLQTEKAALKSKAHDLQVR
jgi:chromosome segregation ATPase